MRCKRQIQERMVSLAAGELAPARAWLLQRHLRRCDACRRDWEETRAVWQGLREMASEPVPEAIAQRVDSALPDLTFPPLLAVPPGLIARQRVPWAWFGAAGAAAVLVALVGLVIILREESRAVGPRVSRVAQQPARVARSGRLAQLPAALRRSARRTALRPGILNGTAEEQRERQPLKRGTPLVYAAASRSRRVREGSAALERPIAADPGDLALVNGDPSRAARRWASLPAEGWDMLEARVRRAVTVRDDFVQLPFPRLASTSDRQIAGAVESYKREAAVVDPRLSREVTLRQKATALVDLCERLRSDTGVQLAAGSSVADEKVTLFCKKLPLRDVMRQLARPFGYTWLRSATAGEYRYELVQDLRSQLLEEELRNRDRNAALLALEKEIERFRTYLSLSPDEALARSRTADPAEKPLLEKLAGYGWGPIHMYSRLSRLDLEALRAGRTLTFSADPRPGEQLLPADVARGVLQSFRDRRVYRFDDALVFAPMETGGPGGLPATEVPQVRALVNLTVNQSELGQMALNGQSGAFTDISRPKFFYTTLGQGPYAVGMSPTVLRPENDLANARLARDPALRLRITLQPKSSCELGSPADAGEGPAPEPKTTPADVLDALHQATGLPIVSDYYTRLYRRADVSMRHVPLFAALNQLADAMRLRWSRDGRWLQFRSTSYYDDRLKEVPNRLLLRWAVSRRQHGALTLDDLVEIAQLADAQLDAGEMAEGARNCFGLREWDLGRNGNLRPHLRFLAGLTPAQRQEATSATGLPFIRMSLAQQQQYLSHALAENPFVPPLQSLGELAGATLRVEYTQPGWFQWGDPSLSSHFFQWVVPIEPGRQGRRVLRPPVRERTREAALEAVRRIDPQVRAAAVQTVRELFEQKGASAPALPLEAQIFPTELGLSIVYIAGTSNDHYIRILSGWTTNWQVSWW